MDDEVRKAIEALAQRLGEETARNDAHLVMISAILNALRQTDIGAFNTARIFFRQNEKQFVQENARGALIREFQFVLKEVFESEPFGHAKYPSEPEPPSG